MFEPIHQQHPVLPQGFYNCGVIILFISLEVILPSKRRELIVWHMSYHCSTTASATFSSFLVTALLTDRPGRTPLLTQKRAWSSNPRRQWYEGVGTSSEMIDNSGYSEEAGECGTTRICAGRSGTVGWTLPWRRRH